MEINLAKLRAEFELEKFPDLIRDGWRVEMTNRAVDRLGCCFYTSKRIVISTKFAKLNGEKQLVDCTLHEIAHALVGPGHGHGFVWKAQALKLGIEPKPCAGSDVVLPPKKWCCVCHRCSQRFYRQKAPRKFNLYGRPITYSCPRCGPAAVLIWRQTEELANVQ